jgi:hypothetical protein
MTHKNRKKLKNFMFLSDECSLLRAEGFSCGLNALCRGLGIAFFILKKYQIFGSCKYFSILGHQNPGSGSDPDPGRYSA